MPYFAAAVARTASGWHGQELDLHGFDDLDQLADGLRDLAADSDGPSLLLVEEDDEYFAVVRVDGGSTGLAEPRVFLSDRRAVEAGEVAALLWPEEEPAEPNEEDEDEPSTRALAEPAGDADLLADLGTPAAELRRLATEEGLLPADVLAALCERAGCLEVLEGLREA